MIDYKKVPWEVWAIGGGLLALWLLPKMWTTENGQSALNPANPQNPINSLFNDIYQGVTGSAGTLGGDMYDLTHTDSGSSLFTYGGWFDLGAEVGQGIRDLFTTSNGQSALNPANTQNPINAGFEGLYKWLSGSTQSPAGDLYDWVNN